MCTKPQVQFQEQTKLGARETAGGERCLLPRLPSKIISPKPTPVGKRRKQSPVSCSLTPASFHTYTHPQICIHTHTHPRTHFHIQTYIHTYRHKIYIHTERFSGRVALAGREGTLWETEYAMQRKLGYEESIRWALGGHGRVEWRKREKRA